MTGSALLGFIVYKIMGHVVIILNHILMIKMITNKKQLSQLIHDDINMVITIMSNSMITKVILQSIRLDSTLTV